MDNKADVRAIMARFQAGGGSTDETSSTPAGRTKQPVHPTLSSGPSIQPKKPVLESLSGSALNASKPPFLKKEGSEAQEPNKTKALASRFGNIQEDSNTNIKPFNANKQIGSKPPLSHPPETKGPVVKPPFNKPPLVNSLSDSKPVFPKPSPVSSSKPSWAKEDSGGSVPLSTIPTPPKMQTLQQKPSSSVLKLRQQNEDQTGANTDSATKPSPLTNSTPKPVSNFRNAQNIFNKEEKNGQPDSGGATKPPIAPTNSFTPPKPPTSKKPSLKKPSKTPPQDSNVNGDGSSEPKRNPLPNSLALGAAPAKPNRPPKVDLENFKRGCDSPDDGPGPIKKTNLQPPNRDPQPPPALPSLPPRHPGSVPQDIYDDVDEVTPSPPPLPPSAGHPSQRVKEEEDDDGEMYEDLDERWETAEKQDKKKNKDDKEEKKRLEAEKKEQKEREKKEQEARKKFKLVGTLEVLQSGKARVDYKGCKTDLALKQGENLDIIRVQGNPEGKWLGRTQDGSIGYVKITSVEIDFNSLKNRQNQPAHEPEVYDDIDVVSSDSGKKGPGIVLPPLPGEGGEIYDDVVDPNLEVSPLDSRSTPIKPLGFLRVFDRSRRLASSKVVPPPSQFSAEGKAAVPIDEDIYDDVDSQTFPAPPPISSLPPLKNKSKIEEMDPKKQKKFEKEEKDFRKKFKFDGEIQVLYEVTVSTTLSNKKWSGKELPIKPGEKLDVIVKPVDNKLICRNEEGKFGYVSVSHIDMDDGDIYDDIGDDTIYDND